MPSQFFGLMIAGSGLRNANAALNTTNNNIANATTEGYSRQTVVQEARDPLRVFAQYGCAGAGVETIAIERNRNEFFDAKYRSNNTRLGVYEIKEYYQMQVQQYLKDDGKTGFSTIYNNMANALQKIITNGPDSNPAKKDFISTATSMAEYFNTMAADLEKIQKDINDEIKLTVDSINSIASTISTLNKQINTIEMSGSAANALRDKRDLLVDQLSELVDVETRETPIIDPADPTRETGGTRYLVKIAGGQTLVDGDTYQQLECNVKEGKVNQSDAQGLYDISWTNGNVFTMTNPSIGGKLQGLIEMRDGNNNYYFNGKVRDVVSDPPDHHKLSVEVNDENLMDLNKCTLPESGEVQIGALKYAYDSWEYDETTHTYTFVINDAKCDRTIGKSAINQTAQVGEAYDYQGIPYYMEQMNEWIRSFAGLFNEAMQNGYTCDGKKGTWLFTAGKVAGGQYGMPLKPDGSNDKKNYYRITAFNLQVNQALIDDPSLLATKKDPTLGVDAYHLITDLYTIMTDKSSEFFRGGSPGEFLDSLLGDVALNAGSAETFVNTYEGIKKSVSNQRLSVMGVDEEEEGVYLVKFQHNFNMASKMIQTLTEVYDRLILETGV